MKFEDIDIYKCTSDNGSNTINPHKIHHGFIRERKFIETREKFFEHFSRGEGKLNYIKY